MSPCHLVTLSPSLPKFPHGSLHVLTIRQLVGDLDMQLSHPYGTDALVIVPAARGDLINTEATFQQFADAAISLGGDPFTRSGSPVDGMFEGMAIRAERHP